MSKKLMIVTVHTDTRNGEKLGAAFFRASRPRRVRFEQEGGCRF